MTKYDIIFITTFIDLRHIGGLINSILVGNGKLRVKIILVNQFDNGIKTELKETSFTDIQEISIKRGGASSSSARNAGIKLLVDQQIDTEYIMFPDDDSTFDKYFFDHFEEIIEKGKNYLIDVYGAETTALYIDNRLASGALISNNSEQVAMAVNLLIYVSSYQSILFFDEQMGVGAKYGAGEDSDYFFRAVEISGPFIYTKELWNYHPKHELKHKIASLSNLLKKYRNYGRGVIYLNFKHRLYLSALNQCFRALVGAIIALCKFEFKLSIARFYAFFIRTHTLILLSLRVYK